MKVRALRLDNYGVKSALQHPLLKGKKLIGRGCFSMVFEGSRKNTVFKVSCDNIGYWLLNDYCMRVEHRHFPRIIDSHGDIGETRINGKDYLIFLSEVERLEKLDAGSPQARLSRQIRKACGAASDTAKSNWREDRHAQEVTHLVAGDKNLPRSIRNAFAKLNDFTHNFEGGNLDMHGGNLDMHGGNFMQRKNGELVMIDPLANMKIYLQAEQQLIRRGW